ncbi:hypothetical protein [Roseococcus sp. YIM B11640]|uniref:hypothetical protein n=1 Tax=Roseococcus sp. YIM B11640 TaxID=3133973 RepID=UPI003C7DAB63
MPKGLDAGWTGIRGAAVAWTLVCLGTACTPAPEQFGPASLPSDAVTGAGDPLRSSVIAAASAFASPGSLPPAAAARSIARMEFLAANLPGSPTLRSSPPTLQPQLDIARAEWRGALGIAPDAPAQPVIDGLYAAGRALDAGQNAAAAAALSAPPFQRGGPATLAQLSSLPPLPRTAAAALAAQQTLVEPSPSGRRRF